jgi:hypothetical protein
MSVIIGVSMLVSLTVGFFIYLAISEGINMALKVYSLTAGISTFVFIATYLICK